MDLLIACLLIYHLDLQWWWYAIASVVWVVSLPGVLETIFD